MGNRVTPTRVGSDGTGYYRDSNGTYYYGNPQNGYLTKTQAEQQRNAAQRPASVAASSQSVGSVGGGHSFLLSVIAGIGIWSFLIYLGFWMLLLMSLVQLWPNLLLSLVMSWAGMDLTPDCVLRTVNMAAVIMLFVHGVRHGRVYAGNTYRFVKYTVLITAASSILIDLLSGSFGFWSPIGGVEDGLQLAVAPGLIFHFVLYHRSGGRRYLHELAIVLRHIFPVPRMILKIFGIVCTLVAVAGLAIFITSSAFWLNIVAAILILLIGIFTVYASSV